MARISYVDKQQGAPEARELLAKLESRGLKVLNVYKVMGHSPAAMRACMGLGNTLLTRTGLDAKLRELAILRVAQLTDSRYEWMQHLPIALEVGVSQEQVDSLASWPRSKAFSEKEKALLAYTDEVTERVRVSDETFSRLRQQLDEREILELTLCAGYWGLIARLLVALQVDLEAPAGSLRTVTG